MLKAVLFDMDGTLINSAPQVIQAMQGMLADKYGRKVNPESLRKYIGPPLGWSMADLGLPQDEIASAIADYRARYSKEFLESALFDGIVDILRAARDLGLGIGLATSKPLPMAKDILAHHQVDEYFDAVAGADFTETRSDKAIMVEDAILGLEERGFLDPGHHVVPYSDGKVFERDDVVLIGDRIHDIDGASKNGVRTILVRWGQAPEKEFALAWRVVENADELITLLRELAEVYRT